MVQEARKNSGFDVSDRITLVWHADGDTAEALKENDQVVADEVLAPEGLELAADREAAEAAVANAEGFVRDDQLGLVVALNRVPTA